MARTQSVQTQQRKHRLGFYEEVIGIYKGRVVQDGENCIQLEVNGRRLFIPLSDDEWRRARRLLSKVSIGQKIGVIHLPEAKPQVRVRVIRGGKER